MKGYAKADPSKFAVYGDGGGEVLLTLDGTKMYRLDDNCLSCLSKMFAMAAASLPETTGIAHVEAR